MHDSFAPTLISDRAPSSALDDLLASLPDSDPVVQAARKEYLELKQAAKVGTSYVIDAERWRVASVSRHFGISYIGETSLRNVAYGTPACALIDRHIAWAKKRAEKDND